MTDSVGATPVDTDHDSCYHDSDYHYPNIMTMKRKSRQKEAIIKILRDTSSHPSTEWIYEQVRREMPSIGLATVYRNLRLLREAGEVSEIRTSHDKARFDGNTSMHYHFCCDRCGKILDLDEPVDTTIETRIERRTGLKVTRHHLEMHGLCLECQNPQIHTENCVPD